MAPLPTSQDRTKSLKIVVSTRNCSVLFRIALLVSFCLSREFYQHKYHHRPTVDIIGASLKRAPQLRVDLAFCHDIYIYRPADLCLWSGARRQGRMLRAKSSRRNFVWERSSVLVYACSFTFVFEFVTDRTCQSLAFAFDCQHWTTLSRAKNIRTSEKCHQVKEAGTFFCLRASRHRNMFFVFRFTCPSRKPIRQNNAFIATHCRVSFFGS